MTHCKLVKKHKELIFFRIIDPSKQNIKIWRHYT